MTVVLPELIRVVMPNHAVETIPFEDYIRGVVAAEMDEDAPLDALKAQAIASRTYAATMNRHRIERAQVCTTAHCQSWRRIPAALVPNTARAVLETRGLILTFNDQPIQAFFFEHCDGHTRDGETVLLETLPYLRGVACPCGFNALQGHGIGMCQRGAIARARRGDSFERILKTYYAGIALTQIGPAYEEPRPTEKPAPMTAPAYEEPRPAEKPAPVIAPAPAPEPARPAKPARRRGSRSAPTRASQKTRAPAKKTARRKKPARVHAPEQIAPTPPPAPSAPVETSRARPIWAEPSPVRPLWADLGEAPIEIVSPFGEIAETPISEATVEDILNFPFQFAPPEVEAKPPAPRVEKPPVVPPPPRVETKPAPPPPPPRVFIPPPDSMPEELPVFAPTISPETLAPIVEPTSGAAPTISIDHLPGPRVIAGDLAAPWTIIHVTDPECHAVVTVTGTAPHYGSGGFEIPLENDGEYLVRFDGQEIRVSVQDESAFLYRQFSGNVV